MKSAIAVLGRYLLLVAVLTAISMRDEMSLRESVPLAALFSLHLLVFDAIATLLRHKAPKFFSMAIYVACIILSVLVDIVYFYVASSGEPDAGFALIVPLILSPLISLVALILFAIKGMYLVWRPRTNG